MKIYIGTDHAGYKMKEELKEYLSSLGYEVVDKGAYEYNEGDDYPDFIIPTVESVASDKESLGIILGGSGQGEAIVANKIKGIRASVYNGGNIEIPKLSKKHNNANILSLGARFISIDDAKNACKVFIETPFSNEDRHIRRIGKITNLENK